MRYIPSSSIALVLSVHILRLRREGTSFRESPGLVRFALECAWLRSHSGHRGGSNSGGSMRRYPRPIHLQHRFALQRLSQQAVYLDRSPVALISLRLRSYSAAVNRSWPTACAMVIFPFGRRLSYWKL